MHVLTDYRTSIVRSSFYRMVRLYSINVFYKGVKPVQKKASYELSSFGFFHRSR